MIIDDKHKDAILEIINIGIGKGANVLNQILKHHVSLEVPKLDIYDNQSLNLFLEDWGNEEHAAVEMQFSSSISGSGLLIFPIEYAASLVQLFIQDLYKKEDMDILNISALNEIGNIVINSVISTFSDQFDMRFQYDVPEYKHGSISQIMNLDESKHTNRIILLCKTSFKVTELDIMGKLILIFEMETFQDLVQMIDKSYDNLFSR